MKLNESPLKIATAALSQDEVLLIARETLAGEKPDFTEPRLIFAADILEDACFEVMTLQEGERTIQKWVVLGEGEGIDLIETGVYAAVSEAFSSGKIAETDLQALGVNSSAANSILKAIEAGAKVEDLKGGQLRIMSVRLGAAFKAYEAESQTKPSFLDRVLGRSK